MIELTSGNLLKSNAEALVNTVNTFGVMGKGIALQFRESFPDNYKFYLAAHRRNELQIGKMLVFHTNRLENPKYIINFPTKRHWNQKSNLEDIECGLFDLVQVVEELQIKSLAIPPLGCGSGGLLWSDIYPLMKRYLTRLDKVQILLFAPFGPPTPEDINIATTKPVMTVGRASLIYLIDRYALPGYHLTRLEIQKLMYFLQITGEPLRLDYVKKQYGPYAENLNFVLQRLEGHYIRGYGDRTNHTGIRLLPGAKEDALAFLSKYPETMARLQKVESLIDGFETPYGMELLATVHWLANADNSVRTDYQAAVKGFKNWNSRKREHFRAEHIKVAWERLRDKGWI